MDHARLTCDFRRAGLFARYGDGGAMGAIASLRGGFQALGFGPRVAIRKYSRAKSGGDSSHKMTFSIQNSITGNCARLVRRHNQPSRFAMTPGDPFRIAHPY
jgi:hypothetical protein